MPNDTNSRAVSAITGAILLMAALSAAYTNSTYQGAVWSLPLVGLAAFLGVSAFLKLATAVGMSSSVVHVGDSVASLGTLAGMVVFGWRALFYYRDGGDGFWAAVGAIGLAGSVVFGLTDMWAAWFGDKYAELADRAKKAGAALAGDL